MQWRRRAWEVRLSQKLEQHIVDSLNEIVPPLVQYVDPTLSRSHDMVVDVWPSRFVFFVPEPDVDKMLLAYRPVELRRSTNRPRTTNERAFACTSIEVPRVYQLSLPID
jgi:hypothetical protein